LDRYGNFHLLNETTGGGSDDFRRDSASVVHIAPQLHGRPRALVSRRRYYIARIENEGNLYRTENQHQQQEQCEYALEQGRALLGACDPRWS